MTLNAGDRLGPYQIVALLGAGGMGEVYRARDTRLDRDVALKVLPQVVLSDADRLARFEREAKVLASVNHPNIAQVFGLEEGRTENGSSTTAIVMELIEGEDLSAIITRGPISVAEAIAIARQIAEALEAAHEQGIVHRDLKPANVKVRADGAVKVLDFGLAKAVESATATGGMTAPTITTPAMTHAGVVLGTAAYMSPEQAKGKFVDRRTDIWAFGAVLYEMLTGARAFYGEDVTDTIVAVVSKEPDWARLPADTPATLRMLLRRCLEKDAKRRLRDSGEARVMLEDLQSGRSAVESAVAGGQAGGGLPLWPRAVPVLAAVLLIIVVGVAAWSRLTPAAPPAAVTRFSVPIPADVQFIRTASRLVAISPDGSQIVHVGNRQLYARAMSELEAKPIRGTAGLDPSDPFFSPDGQWIAFFAVSDGSLRKIAVSGGAAVALHDFGPPNVGMFQGGIWDGSDILFAQVGTGIMRISADGGTPETLLPVVAPQMVYGPQWLPGRRALLFSQTLESGRDSWDRGDVVAFSPTTGERKVVVRGGSAARYLPSGHLLYSLGNTVLALPFDAAALEVRGGPVPMVEGVRRAADFRSGAVQLAVSDSGAMVFVPGEGVGDANTLALVDRSGKVEPLDLAPMRHSYPRISPDQRRLALMTEEGSESVIWVADIAAGATPRRLTFDGRNRFPVWSPDSRDIAYISDRSGRDALYRQAADGSGTAERLAEIPRLLTVDAWHPDGKSLLVMVGGDVWLVTPGSEPKPLVATSAPERHGAFSPEGKWFAYVRVVGTTPEVFVEPFPPTGVSKFQVSNGGGVSPVWSRDGKQLIFNAEARGAAELPGRLLAVDVRTEPSFSFGSPRPVPTANAILGGIRQFDVSADGRVLVRMPVAVERQRDQINVVLNWIEDVKARVPTR